MLPCGGVAASNERVSGAELGVLTADPRLIFEGVMRDTGIGSLSVEEGRLDQVRINVQWEIVEITSAERDWLLNKIGVVSGFESIVAKFEAVGASRPVELDFDERARLRAPLEFWEHQLTDGLVRLLDALVRVAPGGDVGTPRFEA